VKSLLFALLSLSSLLVAQSPTIPPDQPLILTHVTVIDATGSPAKPDMTVVIRDHRIVALGRTGAAALQDAEIEERLKLESSQIWCCSMQIRSTTFLIRRRFDSHRERPVSQP